MGAGAPLLRELAHVANRSCQELLEHYRVATYVRSALVAELPAYQGSVSLVGPDVRGMCVVRADEDALRAAVNMPLTGSALLDWVGEIANQLAGRIKHRLGRRGLRTALGLPVTAVGDLARHVASMSGMSGAQLELACRRQGIAVEVYLDVEAEPASGDFSIPPQDPAGVAIEFVEFDLEFCTTLAPKRAG